MNRNNTRIVFMGTPDFAVASLDAIHNSGYNVVGVVTVPDRQTGRGLKVTFSPVKQYAIDHNIPLLQPEKLRDPQFQQDLQALQADIFVVVAFRMLPKDVWAMPPLGTFNLHASLLPQYRGAAPINWAIINGEKESGITTFMLNEKIDEGGILLQERTPISDDETVETLHDRMAEMGRNLVVRTLDGIVDGTLTPHPQAISSEQKPAPKIFKPDCNIDWSKNCDDIVNFVRGLSPYPAAITTLIDEKGEEHLFKIFKVKAEKGTTQKPGELTTDGKKWVKICANDGTISLLELQLNGKKRNTIEEFLRGHNVNNWKINNYQK